MLHNIWCEENMALKSDFELLPIFCVIILIHNVIFYLFDIYKYLNIILLGQFHSNKRFKDNHIVAISCWLLQIYIKLHNKMIVNWSNKAQMTIGFIKYQQHCQSDLILLILFEFPAVSTEKASWCHDMKISICWKT